jgi:hypothetical protein
VGEFDFAADSGNGTQFKLDGREVLISCAARSPLSTESKEGGGGEEIECSTQPAAFNR